MPIFDPSFRTTRSPKFILPSVVDQAATKTVKYNTGIAKKIQPNVPAITGSSDFSNQFNKAIVSTIANANTMMESIKYAKSL